MNTLLHLTLLLQSYHFYVGSFYYPLINVIKPSISRVLKPEHTLQLELFLAKT